MVRRSIRQIVSRYCRQLAGMGIRVAEVRLYGSQSRGTARPESDIDLIVVSADWAGYNERERLEILGVAAARILEPVQANGFTPEEIAAGQLSPFWAGVLAEQTVPV